MPAVHGIITLNDTTSTILTTDGDNLPSNLTICIQNLSNSKRVFLGDSSVSSTSFGYRLEHDQSIVFERLNKSTELYGISEDGDTDVAVMKFIFS